MLTAFYAGVFTSQFPDPDERESLENMRMYLERKAAGWYGRNNYHLVIADLDGETVGGFVLDYLERPNAGVIEFLFLAPAARGKGLGRSLVQEVERLLKADARNLTGRELDLIVAEMNDPFIASDVPDNMDPFARASMWSRWGYGVLDFPYVQPALSAGQGAVDNLAFIAKPFRDDWREAVPASTVEAAVADYLRWAMRIEDPSSSAEYRAMAATFAGRASVRLIGLDRYIGEDAARPLVVTDVESAGTPAFEQAMSVYHAAFAGSRAAVPDTAFAAALADPSEDHRYRLWLLRASDATPPEGLASFFAFSKLGFCGYVALSGTLAGTGRFRPLLARIERALLEDMPTSTGWLAECEDSTDIAPFLACGFRVLDVPYVPPEVDDPARAGPAMRLLYKPYGRVYEARPLARPSLLETVAAVFEVVYGVPDAQSHPGFVRLAEALVTIDAV